MIVYGDRDRLADPRAQIALLRSLLRSLDREADLQRHAAAVQLLVEAGVLAQGLVDHCFEERGCDDDGPLEHRCAGLLCACAELVQASRRGSARLVTDVAAAHLDALEAGALPAQVRMKQPEGYAFYALYPEQYALAAERLREEFSEPLVVIGIRSIGTGLGAMVAAAAGSATPLVTVRPGGHPFRREIRIGDKLARRLRSIPEARYAIVDEGPGLSGSSFGAVADWLELQGVSRDRIHFFPSHTNDLGPQASEAHRTRWHEAHKHVDPIEETFPALLTDDPELEPIDVAGGLWRLYRCAGPTTWPPANLLQERRKYLLEDGSGWKLARFAGLGSVGTRKLEMAQQLAAEGFTPKPHALRHGFLVEEWLAEAQPLPCAGEVSRTQLVDHLARYLAFRARAFPIDDPRAGAAPGELLAMARHNTQLALGEDAARSLERWSDRIPDLTQRHRPMATDGRLHAWEWLVTKDGRFVKTDAVDHHDAHDCIGAQDLAWDVAGAIVELGLDEAETAQLLARLRDHLGRAPDAEQLRFYETCYLAFQLGAYTMAADGVRGFNVEEAVRLGQQRDAYRERLRMKTLA